MERREKNEWYVSARHNKKFIGEVNDLEKGDPNINVMSFIYIYQGWLIGKYGTEKYLEMSGIPKYRKKLDSVKEKHKEIERIQKEKGNSRI